MSVKRRFLCWIGKHEMDMLTLRRGGLLYGADVCLHCAYVDEASLTDQLWNRKRRRQVARRTAT